MTSFYSFQDLLCVISKRRPYVSEFMLLPFVIATIKINHVASNQEINAPHAGNQFILYNQDLPSDAQNISSFQICDIWERLINNVCVRCDTTNPNLPCSNPLKSNPLCLQCTSNGCVSGYSGTNCQSCSSGYYQTYNGCSQCLMPFGPLYTYSTYIVILWLTFIGSGYAAHYSLLIYVVKISQMFVALSSLSQVNLSWMVGIQTFVLDPLAGQWECYNIPFGYAPIMGLIMVAGFWVANMIVWALIRVYITVLEKYFSDLSKPNMKRVKDTTLGAWSLYVDWQFPILMFRFVQGLQYQWIPNLIGLIVLIILVLINYLGAKWVKAIIFPGTIPFAKFGPSFYKLKPDYFHYYIFNHLWWGALGLSTYLIHPYLQRIIIVFVLLTRSMMHFNNIFKRPITWYGELIILVFGMIWCFAVDTTFGYIVAILALIANIIILAIEIAWCYQKTWLANVKPEAVIKFINVV